ncbi:MAG: radical SAM protein [Candidatus Bathyarchaeia archaeon]
MSTVSRGFCTVCGRRVTLLSGKLGVCIKCIRELPDKTERYVNEAHRSSREVFGLTPNPPRKAGGIPCNICSNNCVMGSGDRSYCGLRWNEDGKILSLSTPQTGLLNYYIDPHVTNCCAAWFCPAGTGVGYPKFAYERGPEYGYANLAVFFYGCNFDCLFCQNYSHKRIRSGKKVSSEELARVAIDNPRISCVCYFGGSPEPQLPFALEVSRKIFEGKGEKIVRICFEWNGCGRTDLVRRAAELSYVSGGNIKFDLKCFTPSLSIALSGVPNDKAYENFRMVAEEFWERRREPPILTATTLLVPHYVDAFEVEQIAKFIAELNPEIPYSLLVFYPQFMMNDLPVTPRKQVEECYASAKKWLRRVNIGNINLLA